MRLMLSIALALVLCVGVYMLVSNNKNGTNSYKAANAQTVKHTFNNIKVELNDGSSMVYNEAEEQKKTRVQLTGEAYFDVKKGTPFIVETNKGTVEVLGTKFNVRAWENQFYVECYEGDVLVKSGDKSYTLKRNTAVLFDAEKMMPKTFRHKAPLWQSGFSNYNNEKINAVFNELERQFNVTVNAKTTDKTFTGSFPHNDLKTALSNICLPNKLKFKISADKKTVDISL